MTVHDQSGVTPSDRARAILANDVAEAETLHRRRPLSLDEADTIFLVVDGSVDVFLATGPRRRLAAVAHVDVGEVMFGYPAPAPNGTRLVALGAPATRVLRIDFGVARDRLLAAGAADTMGWLVDRWLTGLGRRDRPVDAPRVRTVGPEVDTLDVDADTELESPKSVVWVDVLAGAVHTSRGERTVDAGALFVMVPGDRVAVRESGRVRLRSTAQIVDRMDFAELLGRELEYTASDVVSFTAAYEDRERERLRDKHAVMGRELEGALQKVAGALERRRGEVEPVSGADPLFGVFEVVAQQTGFTAVAPAMSVAASTSRLEGIAHASRCRTRPVALEGAWERNLPLPLIGHLQEKGELHPVALLPQRRGAHRIFDPRTPEVTVLTRELAERMHPIAHQLYRPLPQGRATTGWRLLRFAAHGTGRDLALILATGIAVGLLGLLTPILSRVTFSSIIPAGERVELYEVGGGLLLAALAAMIFTVVQGVAVVRLASRMDLNAQAALWDRLLSLPVPFFRDYTAGDLASRAIGIARIRQLLATTVIAGALSLLFSFFNLALLFTYNVGLALVATGHVVLAAGVTLGTGLMQARHVRELTLLDNHIQGSLVQAVTGIAKLRVAGVEARMFARLLDSTLMRQRLAFRQQRLGAALAAFNAGLNALMFAVLFTVIVYTSWGEVDVPTYLAFSAALGVVLAALTGLSNQLVMAAPAVPLYQQLKPILHAEPEVERAGDAPGRLIGEVEVRGVSFRYAQDAPVVLEDVSFSVHPGEFVALVGASGSGKSTMMRLLLGFEQPSLGHVFYDGKELSKLDARAVRRQIGVVLQSSRLVPGSIYDNIVGSSGLTVDDAWEATRLAGIEEDIRAMPMGLSTMVSGTGGAVSGGQAQRLLIARALATRPRLIFFDEATSALDNETQRVVTDSLERLQATRIVIAHRLSTVRSADVILVFDRGRLVESGTFNELLAAKGIFTRLARRQLA